MANWLRKLNISEEWKKADNGELSEQELSGIIAKKLKELSDFGGKFEYLDEEKQELIDVFEDASKDEELTQGYFNTLMNELYNWSDIKLDNEFNGKKCCWINT